MLDIKRLRSLGKQIGDIAIPDIAELCGERYAKLDRSIREAIAEFGGVKTNVRTNLSNESLIKLRVSLVLSDVTSVFVEPGKEMVVNIYTPESGLVPDKVLIRAEWLSEYNIQCEDGRPIMHHAFRQRADAESQTFVREIQRLMDDGRVIVRPLPMIVARTNTKTPKGGNVWRQFDVEPDILGPTWVCTELLKLEGSVPLETLDERREMRAHAASSFVLPYLDGLSFETLGKVLHDEHDVLVGFRAAVKKLLDDAGADEKSHEELLNDVVRPEVEKLHRRFNEITKMQSIRVAGGIALTAILSLMAVQPNAAPAVQLAPFAPVAALPLAIADWVKDASSLKESPYYLLWKLDKAR